MPAPTLSLCMIVKNESDLLERCLTSARPFVDEIVVVDTGSGDGTQVIARRHADVYREIAWPGSFSDARNFSLDQASGSHILILDGDEYIDDADAPAWQRLRDQSMADGVAAALLPVHNLFGADSLLRSERMWQERVYRNTPEIRYMGKVHNQIGQAIQAHAYHTGGRIVKVEAPITHLGYAHGADKMRDKYTPRLVLLQDEIDYAPSDVHRAYYLYQLATVHVVLRDWERVLEVFADLDYDALIPHNRFYSHMLTAQAATQLGRSALALEHANAMLGIERGEPMAYFYAAISMLSLGQIADGFLLYTEAVRINQKRKGMARFNLNSGPMLARTALLCRRAGLAGPARLFDRFASDDTLDGGLLIAALEEVQTLVVRSDPNADRHARQAPQLRMSA